VSVVQHAVGALRRQPSGTSLGLMIGRKAAARLERRDFSVSLCSSYLAACAIGNWGLFYVYNVEKEEIEFDGAETGKIPNYALYTGARL
jgi:hypothetical protein